MIKRISATTAQQHLVSCCLFYFVVFYFFFNRCLYNVLTTYENHICQVFYIQDRVGCYFLDDFGILHFFLPDCVLLNSNFLNLKPQHSVINKELRLCDISYLLPQLVFAFMPFSSGSTLSCYSFSKFYLSLLSQKLTNKCEVWY